MNALVIDQQEIARWISAQDRPLRIAVAFWGSGAIEYLGLSSTPKGTRILLDLSAGASNPDEVEQLMKLLPRGVLASHRLHAKAWIGENDMIVGSANASANGLGAEGSESLHWCELGVRVSDPKVISDAIVWFDRLWKFGSKIDQSDLDRARTVWDRRRRERPIPRSEQNLLEAAIACPEDFKDRRIYIVVFAEGFSNAANAKLDKLRKLSGKQLYAFEDWPQIPINATLVCFDYISGKLMIDNEALICSTNEQTAKRGKLRFVFKKDSVHGLPLGSTSTWIQRIKAFAKNNPKEWNKGDMSVELLEFLKKSES